MPTNTRTIDLYKIQKIRLFGDGYFSYRLSGLHHVAAFGQIQFKTAVSTIHFETHDTYACHIVDVECQAVSTHNMQCPPLQRDLHCLEIPVNNLDC